MSLENNCGQQQEQKENQPKQFQVMPLPEQMKQDVAAITYFSENLSLVGKSN
jgi:hypothetical protein